MLKHCLNLFETCLKLFQHIGCQNIGLKFVSHTRCQNLVTKLFSHIGCQNIVSIVFTDRMSNTALAVPEAAEQLSSHGLCLFLCIYSSKFHEKPIDAELLLGNNAENQVLKMLIYTDFCIESHRYTRNNNF